MPKKGKKKEWIVKWSKWRDEEVGICRYVKGAVCCYEQISLYFFLSDIRSYFTETRKQAGKHCLCESLSAKRNIETKSEKRRRGKEKKRKEKKTKRRETSLRFPFLLSFDRVKWKEENDFSVRATSVNVYQGETVHCGQRLKGGNTEDGSARSSSDEEFLAGYKGWKYEKSCETRDA